MTVQVQCSCGKYLTINASSMNKDGVVTLIVVPCEDCLSGHYHMGWDAYRQQEVD